MFTLMDRGASAWSIFSGTTALFAARGSGLAYSGSSEHLRWISLSLSTSWALVIRLSPSTSSMPFLTRSRISWMRGLAVGDW